MPTRLAPPLLFTSFTDIADNSKSLALISCQIISHHHPSLPTSPGSHVGMGDSSISPSFIVPIYCYDTLNNVNLNFSEK
jgi:hypothetical protein